MEEIKSNPQVYTIPLRVKINPQVYSTHEGRGKIKNNPRIYTTWEEINNNP